MSWLWKLFGSAGTREKTTQITIPKYSSNAADVTLSAALQYGTAKGIAALQSFIKDFAEKVYQPGYADWTVLVDTGSTDGWARAVLSFCNPGEVFLTEDWTYPSAMATCRPFNITPIGVSMDREGMRSDELRKILAEWNEEERGTKRCVLPQSIKQPCGSQPDTATIGFNRPHVMYTVPIGQNPSGAVIFL